MTSLTPPATIAFIGLGMMGRPMASRLAGSPQSGTCITEYLPQNTVGYPAGWPPEPADPVKLSTMNDVPSHEIVWPSKPGPHPFVMKTYGSSLRDTSAVS